MRYLFCLLFMLFAGGAFSLAQVNSNQAPQPVTYCELSKDPGAYNHVLVRLKGFVTHGFEDFSLSEPDCPTQGFSIWLMYGGTAESGTMYCCPGEAAREERPQNLKIEGVETPLVDDNTFKDLRKLLKNEPDSTVRADLVGTFFSGRKVAVSSSTYWRGFGHMGCCSLLVIEKVESFEPHTRSDLDYTAEAGWYESEGCKWGSERDLRHASVDNWNGSAQAAISLQQQADGGQSWMFSDPHRVAIESLEPFYPGQRPILRLVKRSSGRYVYRWRKGKKSIVVVVSRPYWLSHYAASKDVAWISTMIKEAECD